MRHMILAAAFVGMFALSVRDTYACSCTTPEVSQAFSEARAVFIGEVTEITEPRIDDPKAPLSARLFSVKFKVEKAWKGAKSKEITILSDQGRTGCFSWGSFLKGKKYIVYAEDGRAPVGVSIKSLTVLFSCNRTSLFANAADDLKKINEMSKASL